MHKPTMLVILDGFGYRREKHGNALAHANMPFWNSLQTHYPSTLLKADGSAVGLPDHFIGNSEVGHRTLGAGKVIQTLLSIIHKAIDDGSFFKNHVLQQALSAIAQSLDKKLHIITLLSDAGVHSHTKHLYALIEMTKIYNLKHVFIHAILDGRDTQPYSASTYLDQLEKVCTTTNTVAIASIQGRFYAMDRDKNWERTHASYDMLCTPLGPSLITPWKKALEHAYHEKQSDEFVRPQLLDPRGAIQPGDGVIFLNFRPDRARQLTEAFINPDLKAFSNPYNTGNKALDFFVTATQYDKHFSLFNNQFLFDEIAVDHTLLDEIASQINPPPPVSIIAETEKYAHVTYFFRGMRDIQLPNEHRTLIPSLKIQRYDTVPEMSAPLITQTLIKSLRTQPAFFYVVNYANADMVGHSGNMQATIKACECLDQQLALLFHEVVKRLSGTLIITADHGNAEEKLDSNENEITSHSCNPVPFLIASKKHERKFMTPLPIKPQFGLANVAPTILKYMNLALPQGMEQKTIF